MVNFWANLESELSKNLTELTNIGAIDKGKHFKPKNNDEQAILDNHKFLK